MKCESCQQAKHSLRHFLRNSEKIGFPRRREFGKSKQAACDLLDFSAITHFIE
jgi:hypothetical protein